MRPANSTGLAWKTAAARIAILAIAGVARCAPHPGVAYPPYGVGSYDGCMSDAYVATTTPVYYEGVAVYWCGGSWYRREGGGWMRYEKEPIDLREHRMRGAPERRGFEPPPRPRPDHPRVHPPPRPPVHHRPPSAF